MTVLLNSERVTEEESRTHRIGQFQKPLELGPGESVLVLQTSSAAARLSALLVGPRNDGDTLDGIRSPV